MAWSSTSSTPTPHDPVEEHLPATEGFKSSSFENTSRPNSALDASDLQESNSELHSSTYYRTASTENAIPSHSAAGISDAMWQEYKTTVHSLEEQLQVLHQQKDSVSIFVTYRMIL
jgi:hypothetical protein